MNEIQIPISPGELLDKITILQIKAERISDPVKVANVKTELEMLTRVWDEAVEADADITALTAGNRGRYPRRGAQQTLRRPLHRTGACGLRHQRRAR
jgi:hypothetical protein